MSSYIEGIYTVRVGEKEQMTRTKGWKRKQAKQQGKWTTSKRWTNKRERTVKEDRKNNNRVKIWLKDILICMQKTTIIRKGTPLHEENF